LTRSWCERKIKKGDKSVPIKAVQQFMLGTVLSGETKARQTLSFMRNAGYEGIELCGFMIRKIPIAVKMLARMSGMPVGGGGKLNWKELVGEAGLKVVGLHEDLGAVRRDPDLIVRNAREMHTKYIVIPGMYRFDFSDRLAVADLAKQLNQAGEKTRQGGVELLYHNHTCELCRVEPGKTAYQMLMEETDPALVNFEFDSYWPTEAGANALAMMESLGDRLKLYHINDRGARVKGVTMTPILKSDSMELGDGNMDLEALIVQAKKVNVDAIILESHRNWVDKSPVRSFQRSAVFLNRHVS
jgi:sugar phosphate isomerase/epimerase